ncbi:MAG: hypothetical protein U1E45_01790 [Geminicoccaceae bacterium]
MSNDIKEALEASDRAYPGVTVFSAQDQKRNWSQSFSTNLASLLTKQLASREGVFKAAVAGERPVIKAGGGNKRTDVRVSDEINGLSMVLSIKTTNFRDYQKRSRISDYNHNLDRFDNEFAAEAAAIHVRHPFAVLIGLFFLPHESVVPRTAGRPSGFARWVNRLKLRAGRDGHDGRPELFERIYVGLYVKDGPARGAVAFFDVGRQPPKFGFPDDDEVLTLEQLLDAVVAEFESRNPNRESFADPGSWTSRHLGSVPEHFERLGYTPLNEP